MKKFIKYAAILVGLFVGIAVIANIAGGGDGDTESEATASDQSQTADTQAEPADAESEDEAEHAAVGEPVRDGKFEFVITDVETGVNTVGDDFMETSASGEYVIVTMTVDNIGDSAQPLLADDQFLIDDQEREFSADWDAGMALESPLVEEINPGNSVEGQIAFDVPSDATIEFAEMHDSAFSDGVLVDLR